MIEIRIHGRGGQGAVSASTILADALFRAGRHAQAFAMYGAERRGAPTVAFVRTDEAPIRVRTMVYRPSAAILLDEKLLQMVDVTAGLTPGGWIVINSPRAPSALEGLQAFRVFTVDASAIARELGLGTRATPLVNTAILGAVARAWDLVTLDQVRSAVAEAVPGKVEENLVAASLGHGRVQGPVAAGVG